MTVAEPIASLLQETFGFDSLRPGQLEVMEHLLAGRSAAAVFPTGGGKSLCYQLPALALDGVTLVVSPLIALMKDQIDQLQALGVAAERLDSTLDADQHRSVMQRVRGSELKLLYVAPERFNNERFREAILRCQVALIAIDEAHCISEWGHNFRPDYLKLAEFARQLQAERVLALTATATPQVLNDIREAFEIGADAAVRTPFHRPNLQLLATASTAGERDALLLQRLQDRPPGPTIVYVTQQKTAEAVAQRLAARGFDAKPYHAGLGNETREQIQDWFMAGSQPVVVATIAFGMGIDKADIRYIYHYSLPKSLENYSQEIGRAGRDGEPSICETLACLDDLRTLENFVYGDTPSPRAVAGVVNEVLDEEGEQAVSFHELGYRHDVRPIVVRTLLTYLELEGVLRGGTPFYSNYQFKPLLSSAEILDKFAGERREFVAGILRHARAAKTWFHVDAEAAAAALHAPRERVVRALDYLAEQGMLELRAAGVRHRYTVLQPPADRSLLIESLVARMQRREEMEIERLGQVVGLLGEAPCLAATLCEHFGEPLEACGNCSACHGGPAQLTPPAPAPTDDAVWTKVTELCQQNANALAEPRAVARLLCGISSPRASRAKLGSHPLFGKLAQVPFPEVLAQAEARKGASGLFYNMARLSAVENRERTVLQHGTAPRLKAVPWRERRFSQPANFFFLTTAGHYDKTKTKEPKQPASRRAPGERGRDMARPRAKELTERELEVMQAFWDGGESTVAEVKEALAEEGRELAYTTVATLVRILTDKGFLRQTHDERPFRFLAVRSFDDVAANLLSDMLERVFRGSRESLLLRLLGQKKLTAKERAMLEQVLREHKK